MFLLAGLFVERVGSRTQGSTLLSLRYRPLTRREDPLEKVLKATSVPGRGLPWALGPGLLEAAILPHSPGSLQGLCAVFLVHTVARLHDATVTNQFKIFPEEVKTSSV